MIILATLDVDAFEYEKNILTWTFESTTESLTNYTIDVYRAEAASVDIAEYDLVASGLSPDSYTYTVTISGLADFRRTWYYKLVTTEIATGDTNIAPTVPAYPLSTITDNAAREIFRRKGLSMNRSSGKVGSGRIFYSLKRKTWGQHCSECWNETLQRVTDPDCLECYGTGWVGGYFNPISFKGMTNPSPKYNEITMFGDWSPSDVLLWTLRTPLVMPKDIIVSDNNYRYRVLQVRYIEGLGRLIEQQAQLALIPVDDVIYEIEIT